MIMIRIWMIAVTLMNGYDGYGDDDYNAAAAAAAAADNAENNDCHVHPLRRKLRLLICKVFGRDCTDKLFQKSCRSHYGLLEATYQESLCQIHCKVAEVGRSDQSGPS